mgnify:CR=1 FL=1
MEIDEINLREFGIFDTKSAFPREKRTKERTVKEFEIEFFLECTGKAIVDGKEYELTPETLLVCHAGQKRSSILHFKCYYLHFTLDEKCKYFPLLGNTPVMFRLINAKAYAEVFSSLFAHIAVSEQNIKSDYSLAKLLELFYRIAEDSERNRNYEELFPLGKGDLIPRVTAYIRRNYGEKVTLAALSEEFHYSPNHIQSRYKKVTGLTPQEFLEETRLSNAKLLLTDREKSLSEISAECGYSSQSHFTASFKRRFSVTPKEWRKNSDDLFRNLYNET